MPAYFDSSLLVSILKKDDRAEEALEIWEKNTERASSLLLEAECVTVLRRFSHHFKTTLPVEWSSWSEKRLEGFLGEIHMKPLDLSVTEVIRREKSLSLCRTLDAVHVATALFLQENTGGKWTFFSFDRRMNETARNVGLATLPTPSQ